MTTAHDHRDRTPATDHEGRRPFGAHLTMRWWVPVVLTVAVVLALYLLQFGLGIAAALIEIGLLGKDPADKSATPLTYLSTNLAIILLVPITLLVLTKAAGVPWRSVLAAGRSFHRRRLAGYLGLFAALMTIAILAVELVQPSPASAFAVTGTTIALLVVVALTTPLQAAAEELVFRGALTASYASWVRASRPALALGIVLSSVLFALVHSSTDPWMLLNYLGLGASTALMALLARGLEPAIAFHVVNNTFAMTIGALFAYGGGISQDRSAGAAGPYLLIIMATEVVAVLLVWRIEARRRAPRQERVTE